jgi:hypothetical protein
LPASALADQLVEYGPEKILSASHVLIGIVLEAHSIRALESKQTMSGKKNREISINTHVG